MSLGHHAAHHMHLSRDRPGSDDAGGEPDSPGTGGQRCARLLLQRRVALQRIVRLQ